MAAVTELETINGTTYQIQKKLCKLSDSLDAIAQVHLHLTFVAQRICDLAMFNLMLWIAFKVSGILLQIFTVYMYTLAWTKGEDLKLPIQILESGVLGSMLCVIEILMMTSVCSRTMEEVICII